MTVVGVLWLVFAAVVAVLGAVVIVREAVRLRRGWLVFKSLKAAGSKRADSEPASFVEFAELTAEQREAVVQAILDGHPDAWRS